mgnify:CR=1 FL=1
MRKTSKKSNIGYSTENEILFWLNRVRDNMAFFDKEDIETLKKLAKKSINEKYILCQK